MVVPSQIAERLDEWIGGWVDDLQGDLVQKTRVFPFGDVETSNRGMGVAINDANNSLSDEWETSSTASTADVMALTEEVAEEVDWLERTLAAREQARTLLCHAVIAGRSFHDNDRPRTDAAEKLNSGAVEIQSLDRQSVVAIREYARGMLCQAIKEGRFFRTDDGAKPVVEDGSAPIACGGGDDAAEELTTAAALQAQTCGIFGTAAEDGRLLQAANLVWPGLPASATPSRGKAALQETLVRVSHVSPRVSCRQHDSRHHRRVIGAISRNVSAPCHAHASVPASPPMAAPPTFYEVRRPDGLDNRPACSLDCASKAREPSAAFHRRVCQQNPLFLPPVHVVAIHEREKRENRCISKPGMKSMLSRSVGTLHLDIGATSSMHQQKACNQHNPVLPLLASRKPVFRGNNVNNWVVDFVDPVPSRSGSLGIF